MGISYLNGFMNGACFMLFLLMGMEMHFSKQNRLQSLLSYILIFWAFMFLKDIVYLLPIVEENLDLYNMFLTVDMWVVPASGSYVVELLRPGWLDKKKILIQFAPFVLSTLLFFLIKSEWSFVLALLVSCLYAIVVLSIVAVWFKRYNKMIKDNYSDITYVDVQWLWSAVLIMICCLFSWAYIYFFRSQAGDILYYLFSIIVWSVIVYHTKKQVVVQPSNYETIQVNMEPEMKSPQSFHFEEHLKNLVDDAYFQRHPQLTLSELAAELKTNRSYLSLYFNSVLHVSFYEYVNNIRLIHAELLLRTTNLSVEVISEQSGFCSISTFRRAFSKKWNVAPGLYRK